MGRTIVLGDIHGCADELTDLLEKVVLDGTDRVVAVGDLTVKGPKSAAVLDRFIHDSRFSSVVGNHDLALLKRWENESFPLQPKQLETYDQLRSNGDQYFYYLASLPLTIDLGTHVVVHAGLRPRVPISEQVEADLTELRTLGPDRTRRDGQPWYEEYDGDKIALFGHWPANEPRRGRRALGIDTGCVYGFRLTAYIIETDELVDVAARKAYASPHKIN
ncbi:MAG TPA: metallophosphoesterase [Pyrinomonadaceae bacterium]|nr:metallophosphoesterase [Pyrinomonadaceae bacterium]